MMINLSLFDLYILLEKMERLNYHKSEIDSIKSLIQKKEILLENTSATGGPSGAVGSSSTGVGSAGVSLANATTAGMGTVQSSTPSHFPGALTGTNWISGGGKEGSGDISAPYNPSGANRVFQKIPAFGKKKKNGDHNVIQKKSRIKGFDIKSFKDALSAKKSTGKVMNFNDFEKKELTNRVNKVEQ